MYDSCVVRFCLSSPSQGVRHLPTGLVPLKPTRRHADLIVSGDTEVSSLASQVMKTLKLKKIAI